MLKLLFQWKIAHLHSVFTFTVSAFICGVSETEARIDGPGTNFNFFHESASQSCSRPR